jgi:hypothetical protein
MYLKNKSHRRNLKQKETQVGLSRRKIQKISERRSKNLSPINDFVPILNVLTVSERQQPPSPAVCSPSSNQRVASEHSVDDTVPAHASANPSWNKKKC